MPSRSVPGNNLPNHLIHEKSPYLRQHAYNPVDWYPWGEEAFRRAKEEKKPVFLSVGYATCHWCHVMAHESFEDRKIASLLNSHFISIKVDREERPDIDSVYMTASQQMTGQGGWPLTIIMTPDKKPFFAGTYFPKKARAGMTGLSEILQKVIRLWKEERDTLLTGADQFADRIAKAVSFSGKGPADRSLLRQGFEELAESFDPVFGGFSRAPKFPMPVLILFLLRYWKRAGSREALHMAETTLESLRCGGIHDHLGGGFHRYSTDNQWFVPHFEKMLYDQALVLMAFTEAYLATKNPIYKKTAESTISYLTRDLLSPEGAFFSAEDADSPGGEGDFYLWTRKELDDVLGPDNGRFAARCFGVLEKGNFPSPNAGLGKNILYLEKRGAENPADRVRIEPLRAALLAARRMRPRPQQDRKILTDWNGLAIAALAQASRAFDAPAYYQTAITAMRFVLDHLRRPGGGLYHRFCDGEAAVAAFADDYAFIIRALIELYETDFDPAWLAEALFLNRFMAQHFSDTHDSGFFTSPDDGEILLVRKKEIFDGAVPSSNSVMLGSLVLLGHLTGNPEFEQQASRLAEHFAGIAYRSPSRFSAYLCGLDLLLGPATDIVIAGGDSDPVAQEMIRMIRDRFLPSVSVHFLPSFREDSVIGSLAPFTRTMVAQNGKGTAYLCSGQTCSVPVHTTDALREFLAGQ